MAGFGSQSEVSKLRVCIGSSLISVYVQGLVFDGIPADVVARYVQFDLKGAESNVRVRQVKVLGYSGEARGTTERSLSSSVIARQKCERETIRIFRLLSSEVNAHFSPSYNIFI